MTAPATDYLFEWQLDATYRALFPAGFEAFWSAQHLVYGLARATESELHIRAPVIAGSGLDHFLAEAKSAYTLITVFETRGAELEDTLLFGDFLPYCETDAATGDRRHGFIWTRAHQKAMNTARNRDPNAWKRLEAREALASQKTAKYLRRRAA